jgi:hypothetical protein
MQVPTLAEFSEVRVRVGEERVVAEVEHPPSVARERER